MQFMQKFLSLQQWILNHKYQNKGKKSQNKISFFQKC